MQVFEFHFNPKIKDDVLYDSFIFEPTNVYEKKLGNLYAVGHLSNALPRNLKFLDKISSLIKKEYYRSYVRSPESALKDGLKKANEYLSEEAKKGDVSWLGNLDFAIISLKDYVINFTKISDVRIFLLRNGQVMDIGKNLEIQEIEPYPLKVFGNIVSGKLIKEDKILVLTKEIFDFFSAQNLIQEIANLEVANEKVFKKLIKIKEKFLLETSGICFLIDLKEVEVSAKERLVLEKKVPLFSIWPNLVSAVKLFLKIPLHLLKKVNIFGKFRFGKNFPKPSFRFRLPKIKIPKKSVIHDIDFHSLRRNLTLVLILAFILLIGISFSKLEKQRNLERTELILEEVRNKMDLAKRALFSNNDSGANKLYQEALKEILPLAKDGVILDEDLAEVKVEIEKQLLSINKLEKVDNPELLFSFNGLDFIPQKQVLLKDAIYLFGPTDNRVYKFNISGKVGDFIQADQKFNLAVPVERQMVVFYSRPDALFPLRDGQFGQKSTLQAPYSDFHFDSMAVYRSNLYFLDGKKGEVLKYLYREGEEGIFGEIWLNQETKRPSGTKSIAVDGSVWALNKNNQLDKYSSGNLKETLGLDIYPFPKDFSKILTFSSLPYLYILEPIQNRIIIIEKSGKIIKQFQSEKFDNLKDFSVSEDGKTIYLLNGVELYKINL